MQKCLTAEGQSDGWKRARGGTRYNIYTEAGALLHAIPIGVVSTI